MCYHYFYDIVRICKDYSYYCNDDDDDDHDWHSEDLQVSSDGHQLWQVSEHGC